MELKEIPMETRKRALREALMQIPDYQAKAVMRSCGLSEQEQEALLEYKEGADIIWIGGKLHMSARTVGRRRATGLEKLRRALEQ